MKIAYAKKHQETVKDQNAENGQKTIAWVECYFRIAGLYPFRAKMQKNKNKEEGSNQPDFKLYYRTNTGNKKDPKFRDILMGALWLKTTVKDGVEKNFMTGEIELLPLATKENPTGKTNIAVWAAQPYYEGEVLDFDYEISILEDREQDYPEYQDNSAPDQGSNNNQPPPTIDIDNDEIPF